MLNKRKYKWLQCLALGLILMVSVPNVAYGTTDEAVVESENNAEEIAVPTATAQPTPTPDPVETNAIPGWPQGMNINSGSACLMDADTGAILYNKAMYEKMYPASMTKVMTALIAIENSSLDEVVVFTETGVAEAYSGSSNLYTQVGEEFTMEACLYALMLKSANDFASQVAEHVGGSVEGFCQMMNAKAASLGCINTNFNNAHGMPDENHYTCAYDMALIMQAAIKNETFRKVAMTQSYVIPATTLTAQRTISSHNALIMPGDYYYEYCIGGKTGYTDSAMCTFVSAAEKDGRTLIECTMFSPTAADSFINAKSLYEYGFNNFTNHVLQQGNNIYSGGSVTLPNGVTSDAVQLIDRGIFSTDFGNMLKKDYNYNEYLVGHVAITEESYLEEQRLIAEAEAQAAAEAQAKEQAERERLEKALSEPMLDPINTELVTVPHIIIGVFLVLIGLGILMIIVTIIVKCARRRKKKRRNKQKKEK